MNILLIYLSFQPRKQRFQDINKKSRECPFSLRETSKKNNFDFLFDILKTLFPDSKEKQIHPILLQSFSKNILLITKIRLDTSVVLFGCLEDKGDTKENVIYLRKSMSIWLERFQKGNFDYFLYILKKLFPWLESKEDSFTIAPKLFQELLLIKQIFLHTPSVLFGRFIIESNKNSK